MAVSANRLELLQIAEAVAREKAIDRSIVIAAMEDAIAKAARSRYGAETDVHAEIDPKTGDLKLTRHMLVSEGIENPSNQITLEDARRRHPAAQVGDTIAAVKDEQVTLRSDDAPADAPSDVSLTMDEMSDARLVLTDALVTQALRREKAAKREAKAAKREARHSRQQARKGKRPPNESNEGE